MIPEIIVTYLHFLGFISIFVALVVEKVLFKPIITADVAKKIRAFDAIYGIASVVMLATGFSKMYWFGKGMDYYMHNHIFWTKILLFSIVGILSIYPTITFLKWKKLLESDNELIIPEAQYKRINRMIHLELTCLVLVPLCAHIMARGFGYVQG